MIFFIIGLVLLTAIQLAGVFIIGAFVGVCVLASMAVSRLVFRLTGPPEEGRGKEINVTLR